MKRSSTGVALITVIIFILLLSIIAVAMLSLMTNQSSLIESQARRIKAKYIADAAFQKNFMRYAAGTLAPPATEDITESVDGTAYTANVVYFPGPPAGLSSTVQY